MFNYISYMTVSGSGMWQIISNTAESPMIFHVWKTKDMNPTDTSHRDTQSG